MLRNLIILFSLCGLTAILSCKKDKPCSEDVGEHCEDIQNVKKFFAFKVGSWWLYEEENSGERDSVYVTQYANDPSNYNFDVRMYSTHQDYFYHYWPEFSNGAQNCNESGITCSNCIRIKRSKYKVGEYIGEGRCFIFVGKKGDFEYVPNISFANNKIVIQDILKDFSLINLDFERTFIINELNTYIEYKQPTNHYFSENVGVVRKELLDSNQVWNLIDYYIQE